MRSELNQQALSGGPRTPTYAPISRRLRLTRTPDLVATRSSKGKTAVWRPHVDDVERISRGEGAKVRRREARTSLADRQHTDTSSPPYHLSHHRHGNMHHPGPWYRQQGCTTSPERGGERSLPYGTEEGEITMEGLSQSGTDLQPVS